MKKYLDSIAPSLCAPLVVESDSITPLYSPQEFYAKIVDMINSARSRLLISALYLGNGALESAIVESLEDALRRNPNLCVVIVMDYARGTRGGNNSSASMLSVLKEKYRSRFQVSLFKHPFLNDYPYNRLGERSREAVGVMHAKTVISDDDVMMMGANLSTDYFTNRQDRYLFIRDSPPLSNALSRITALIAHFSHKLVATDIIHPPSKTYLPRLMELYPSLLPLESFSPDELMTKYLIYSPSFAAENPPSCQEVTLLPSCISTTSESSAADISPLYSAFLPCALDANKRDCAALLSSCGAQRRSRDNFDMLKEIGEGKALFFPIVQFAALDIRQEEEIVSTLLRCATAEKKWRCTLITAYFNPPEKLTCDLARSCVALDVMTAAPEANGFFNSKGISLLIPSLYALFLQRFKDKVEKIRSQRGGERLTIHEYHRPEWTFHGKGFWLCSSPSSNRDTENLSKLERDTNALGDAYLTIIGSSNFGVRSVERDLEVQCLLVTSNTSLKERLETQRNYLLNPLYTTTTSLLRSSTATTVHPRTHRYPDQVEKKLFPRLSSFPLWLRGISRVVKSFL